MIRLDKDVFGEGLTKMQAKFEQRFYTTTIPFAHDLCQVIHTGINVEVKPVMSSEPGVEPIDVSPTKHGAYSKAQDRKRLGKRIIKSVQPQLEAALKAEADIRSKPYADLHKGLEDMINASFELRKPFLSLPQAESSVQTDEDVIMADASDEAQLAAAEGPEDANGDDADKMDIDELSIEVKDEDIAQTNGGTAVNTATEGATKETEVRLLLNGVGSTPTPPDTNGYMPTMPQDPTHPTPLTPPQSNGSFGRGGSGTANPLSEGGVLWYLKPFDPVGTTAVEEQWAGRDAVRSLSEELTDMDEEELNDLEFNVEDSTITASPVDAPDDSQQGQAQAQGQQHLAPPPLLEGGAGRLRSGGGSSRRKASGAAAGKKRLRSSARRR